MNIRNLLNKAYNMYNKPGFVSDDPICIPHTYTLKQDIEIAGLFAAVFAWGQRITIINKCTDLFARMDHAPYAFITSHSESDLQKLEGFVHRTFNDTDLLYFISFLRDWYSTHDTLETAFSTGMTHTDETTEKGLNQFKTLFFSSPYAPLRTHKHISSPAQHSACKRLNMYLRWMVRDDAHGVDFGLWKQIKPSQLVCPLDIHVERVARKLGLLQRKQSDWLAAVELTQQLKQFDAEDPVKYDFALFGLGIADRL